MRRRALILLASLSLVVVLAVGLTQAGDGADPAGPPQPVALAQQQAAVAGAPGPLAELYSRANFLEPGARDRLEERLADLDGIPVVVNKWASWCGPCRLEFPYFQTALTTYGKRVAFIGLNAADNAEAAAAFLGRAATVWPNVEDPDLKAAGAIGANGGFPTTVFYDASGEQAFVHQGSYTSQDELDADIERHALR